jgi:pantoate--beta-alanine ligase
VKVIESLPDLRSTISKLKREGRKVAFVPTMGNLHEGHLQLVDIAHQHADVVIASIFVNPMQFGQGEDFEKYPRTHESDIEKLTARQCDLLFLPSVETMYPVPAEQQTRVEVPGLSDLLCGASRPGHFVGVATVVTKLFNLVQPDVAVFGEKDFQQLMVIRRMVHELCMPVEIVGAPISRETDGLARSSRNGYLDARQRQIAPALYAELNRIKQLVQDGETDYSGLENECAASLNQQGFRTDYIAIRQTDNLQAPDDASDQLVILAAAYLGTTRLIDNLVI